MTEQECAIMHALTEQSKIQRARLDEATALLDDAYDGSDIRLNAAWVRKYNALVLASRAPAQPAAPEPSAVDWTAVRNADLDSAMKRAESAEAQLAISDAELLMARAGLHGANKMFYAEVAVRKSAEAQLAAVRDIINDIPESVFTAADVGMLDEGDAIEAVGDLRIIRALLTAPSPGAGKETL